jgi:glycosyltransferase involved in cell wall biosynthesis
LGESSDVGGLLCAADVFVLPSRYEGTAGVVIEAMAVGAPILSVDLEGLHGILADEENALLYPGRDVDALVTGLRRIDRDGDLRERLVENGRHAFEAGFTTGDYVDGMIGLYESVTKR